MWQNLIPLFTHSLPHLFHFMGSGINPSMHSVKSHVVATFDLSSVRSGVLLLSVSNRQ